MQARGRCAWSRLTPIEMRKHATTDHAHFNRHEVNLRRRLCRGVDGSITPGLNPTKVAFADKPPQSCPKLDAASKAMETEAAAGSIAGSHHVKQPERVRSRRSEWCSQRHTRCRSRLPNPHVPALHCAENIRMRAHFTHLQHPLPGLAHQSPLTC